MSTFAQLLAALNEPVLELDITGQVTFATAAACAWTGRDPGYAFIDVLPAADSERFEQAIKRIAAGKTMAATIELNIAPPEGEAVPMEVKLAAIVREGGKVAGIGIWMRDLSMEKANEAAANVQGTHLLDLVENVYDACVVESATGMVEMVNGAFCDLFGIKSAPQSLVGTACASLFEQAAAATDKRVAPLYFPMDSEKADKLDFALASGKMVEQHSLPVAAETGIAGRMHIFHPKVKEETGEAKSSATSAAQMRLVEQIAQDLAVTVEGAVSAIHRAEQLDLPGQVLSHFRRVEASAQSAFTAVAGLVDFSRVESAEIVLESAEFHLREGIAGMLERLVPLAQERNVQLKLKIEQDVPEHLVGDGARLMLCLSNLLSCGLATAERGAEFTLDIEPEYSADKVIHLSFNVHHTQPKGTPRPSGLSPAGTMQLAMSRQIARAFGAGTGGKSAGKIDIKERKESVQYQFTAAFPYRAIKDVRIRPTFVTLTGLPVLVVSDDVEERKQLTEMMKSWRMHPREADNAAMALQLLNRMADEENPIALVITSNQMPVQDGFLLAFRIRHLAKLKQTAVIMLAKAGKSGDAIACRENGISAYLRHPLAPTQLNEAIAAVMGTQDDSEATSTLITRHSLREAKAGAVLIIDANPEQAMFAAGGLKKRDYRVVLVDLAERAYAAMAQEVFDVIIVDPIDSGFSGDKSVPDQLRANLAKDSSPPKILIATDTPAVDTSAYDGMLLKPLEKTTLVATIGELIPQRADA
jgi:DNA-binding response OmpR family regulator